MTLAVSLRLTKHRDAHVLLEWRNDETTRRFSFSEDVVQWDDHVQWLERTLADATSRLWIAEVDGAPVGQIRAQRGAGGIAELHLAVAPDARGRGLAAAMIGAAALAAGRELGVRRLLGRVKADNARSQRAFARAGFAADGEEHWVRDLVPGPVVTVVQARMGSTRLPGKVLADLGGRPMLALLLDRVTRAGTVDAVVVATTVEPRDDAIADLAAAAGVPVFRGSEADVLGRFEGAADLAGAGTVVRVTADCPLVAPEGIDLVVGALGGEAADLATNSPPTGRTWPDGLDVEAFTRKALTRAAAAADDPSDREHVTRWFHTSGEARVAVVDLDPPLGNMRITIDTAADLELVRGVLERLGGRTDFTLDELLAAALVRPAE